MSTVMSTPTPRVQHTQLWQTRIAFATFSLCLLFLVFADSNWLHHKSSTNHQQSININNKISSLGDHILSYFLRPPPPPPPPSLQGTITLPSSPASPSTAGLATWSESSIYVELTSSLHPSRPSAFGPKNSQPLRASLFPIENVTRSGKDGCNDPFTGQDPRILLLPLSLEKDSTLTPQSQIDQRLVQAQEDDDDNNNNDPPPPPPGPWIALVLRGNCPFSTKVRHAQRAGASAVLFGDLPLSEGGLGGVGGLLTPWSPDDTSDIDIPSAFVSRQSFVSLGKSWVEVQQAGVGEPEEQSVLLLARRGGERWTRDLQDRRAVQGDQDDEEEKEKPLKGLMVVMSKDELFAWPLLDFLLLLLFLPSLLTLLTVFTHRIRLLRQRKKERAPKDVVGRLPVFVWPGSSTTDAAEDDDEERQVGMGTGGGVEKKSFGNEDGDEREGEGGEGRGGVTDEESAIGIPRSRSTPVPVPVPVPATESTPLLTSRTPSNPSPPAHRLLSLLFPSLRPLRSTSLPSSSPSLPSYTKRREAGKTKFHSPSTECAICLSDFEKGEEVMELPCGHLFHKDEVVGWLVGGRGVCPVCRASVTSPSTPVSSSSSTSTLSTPTPSSPTTIDATNTTTTTTTPILIVPPLDMENERQRASPVASSSGVTLDEVQSAGRGGPPETQVEQSK